MSPRWSWDFEDAPRRNASDVPAGPSGPGSQPPRGPSRRTIEIRRRRAAAIVLAAVALVALVVAISADSHGARKPAARHPMARAKLAHASLDLAQREAAAVRSVLRYTPFVKEGSTSAREVALTFDDGPGPYTPRVLSVLERYHVRATFFVIGKMLRYFSASTVREIEDGDVIGDHTETHPMMAQLTAHDQYEELFEQILRVEALGASRPQLFRPPYGSFDATTMRQLAKLHLLMVLWSVDTDDYLRPGVNEIVERALAGAHPGAIILMHDAGGERQETIEALPRIIRGLRERGYRLVTIPRLLADDPPARGQPLPPNLSGD